MIVSLLDTCVLSISIIGNRLKWSCKNLTTRHVPFAETPPGKCELLVVGDVKKIYRV